MLGQRIYARLADIPEPVDMVDIFRASQYALAIVQEALALKPRPQVIWMQLGVRNDEAAALAEANGLKVVMNRCPKIEYGRLSSEIAWMGVNTRTTASKKGDHRRHSAHVAQPHQRSGRRDRGRRPRPARRRRTLSSCAERDFGTAQVVVPQHVTLTRPTAAQRDDYYNCRELRRSFFTVSCLMRASWRHRGRRSRLVRRGL